MGMASKEIVAENIGVETNVLSFTILYASASNQCQAAQASTQECRMSRHFVRTLRKSMRLKPSLATQRMMRTSFYFTSRMTGKQKQAKLANTVQLTLKIRKKDGLWTPRIIFKKKCVGLWAQEEPKFRRSPLAASHRSEASNAPTTSARLTTGAEKRNCQSVYLGPRRKRHSTPRKRHSQS